jgi:hypothetical protein
MTPEEAMKLCRMTKALIPQMTLDEFTPQAWALAFEDDRYEDAAQALKELSREQPFVGVSEIVGRIKRIRRDRVLDFGPLPDPPAHIDPDNQRAHSQWLKETTLAIADGRLTRDDSTPDAIAGRDVIAELGQARSVDSALAARPLREAHEQARRELQAAEAERKRERDERQAELERMRQADRAARATTTEPHATGCTTDDEEMSE